MEHNISILFYTKKSRTLKNNLIPIYFRVTINGGRIEQATGRSINISQWSSITGKVKGTHAAAKDLNNYLDTIRHKVYVLERQMIQDGTEITYQTFKEKWFGVPKSNHMVIE